MYKVIRVIGALVLAILLMSVPVIFGVSIAADWCPYISLFLGIGTMGEICVVGIWIYFTAEE